MVVTLRVVMELSHGFIDLDMIKGENKGYVRTYFDLITITSPVIIRFVNDVFLHFPETKVNLEKSTLRV